MSWDAPGWQQRDVRCLPALLLSITSSPSVMGECQLPDLSSSGSSCLSAWAPQGCQQGRQHSSSSPCCPLSAARVCLQAPGTRGACAGVTALPPGAAGLGGHCPSSPGIPSWEGSQRGRSCCMARAGSREGARGKNHLEQSSWMGSRAKRPQEVP